jgi:tetratricopeptide (TPR) repeat protein
MNDRLQQAKKLIDDEQYEQAIEILESLNNLFPKEERFKLLLLSASLYEIGKYDSAIDTANMFLQKSKKGREFGSQIKYLSYAKLGEYDKAFEEIINFLSSHKANLYKVTLEELLTDIKNKAIRDEWLIEKIQELANENNVSL